MDYLDYQFVDSEDFVNTYDEVPLWSASFGLLLLKHLELKANQTILDIGSGTGFPLFELAERVGNSCKLFGLDPWKNANLRAQEKIKNYGISNTTLIESSAENLPFEDQSLDLIVSNLGINNFDDPDLVYKECHRVLKTSGKLVITTNLHGHWKELYEIWYQTLHQIGNESYFKMIENEEAHRRNLAGVYQLFTNNGFQITKAVEDSFTMKFLDGSAFLNHHFIQLGWLTGWISLFPKAELQMIFAKFESNLTQYAKQNGGLNLTVPMAYIAGEKL
ncbi:MAG TPA: methyltransferase domain-containing protein [Saprospiraceae bacterium]|nr:methyltransferase domain-containing protein [Saprospiraceae bacterium]HPN68045.1 methyltransferase domain-containing protein [Saprospiraceae bacterium]